MAHTDQVADMLTRIRNAALARHKSVDIPASKLKAEIARILQEQNYIRKYAVLEDSKQGVIRVLLGEGGPEGTIRGLRRWSTPGRRVYKTATTLPRVLNGMGVAIVSTSKGVMTDKECRKLNVGGELLCTVW